MKKYYLLFCIALLCALSGCNRKPEKSPVSLIWEMGRNQIEWNIYESTFHITNNDRSELDRNWIIYFNQSPAEVVPQENAQFNVEQISATYYKIYPSPHYRPIASGQTVSFAFRCRGDVIKQTNAPEGAYFIKLDENGNEITKPITVDLKITPYTHDYQWSRQGRDEIPYPYGNVVYDQNTVFTDPVILSETDIFPSIKSIIPLKGDISFTKDVRLEYDPAFKNEADLLKDKLQNMFRCKISGSGKTVISLQYLSDFSQAVNGEYYEIKIQDNKIQITGATSHGVFNANQTLLALLGNCEDLPCRLQNMQIKDYPDMSYRGQMIDVARNFSSKENILKLIDVFSMYKLNVFHFHLTDDEGWRIEIPGMEELTEVGSKRGHTLDETECLYPAYGGGWDMNDKNSTAGGYYTREDYIEILRYAQQRHIKVIPEIDLPGHARSAIKAMNARYRRYIDTDKAKAEEYLLIDFNDTSTYLSAQSYTDNVINVAMPSVYTFVFKVIDEMVQLYEDAEMKLDILHLGGDEVAHGAWEGSEICRRFMKENNMAEVRELKDYFVDKVLTYMEEKNIQLAGWQEVVLLPDETSVNKRFAGRNILSNCWNTIPEWESDEIPYRLANAGCPVILSCVTNLYFDLSYNKHQMEPGAYWGGFVNEYVPFDALPFNIYKSVRQNMRGEKVDVNAYEKTRLPLDKGAEKQIKGMQGQLFAETIRNYDMVEHYLFPKIFGLVDRAWNNYPEWSETPDESAYLKALRQYNTKIAERELPRLTRFNVDYRVALPGIKIINGKLYANSSITNAIIRYTTDGSEPTEKSAVWTKPVDCGAEEVKAKAYYFGKESATTLLRISE